MKLFTLIKGVCARVVVGVSGILIARYLSKDDYGLIVSVATIAALFLTISRLGLNEFTVVRAARAKVNSSKRAYIVLMDKLQNSAVLLMLWPGLAAAILMVPKEVSAHTIAAIFVLIYARGYFDTQRIGVVSATFQTNGSNNRFVDAQLVFSTASVLSLVSLYLFELEKYGYLISSMIATVLMYCVGVRLYRLYLDNGAVKKPTFPTRRQLKVGFNGVVVKNPSYFFSDLMSFGYTQGSAIILISVTSSAEVARYSVIASLVTAGYIIPGVIYQWTLPVLAEAIRRKDDYVSKARKAVGQITLITLPISLIMGLFSSLIVDSLLGEKYSSSASVLVVMALVYFLHSLCFIPAAILTSLSQQRKRLRLQMLSATISIGFTAVAGASFGGLAAAYACLTAEAFLLVGYSVGAMKAVKSQAWEKA